MKSGGHDGLWKVVMRKAGEHGQTTPSRGLYGYTESRVMRPPSEESGKRNTVTRLSKKSEVLMMVAESYTRYHDVLGRSRNLWPVWVTAIYRHY